MDPQKVKNLAERVVPIRRSTRKSIKKIGSPTDFKHLLHIGANAHHVDVSSVPHEWKDILEIAKYCQDVDLSESHTGEIILPQQKQEKSEIKEENVKEDKIEEEFQSEIDLFADLQTSLPDDYKKFLFG